MLKNFLLKVLTRFFILFKDDKKIIFESYPLNTGSSKVIYDALKEENYNMYWIYLDSDQEAFDANHKKILVNNELFEVKGLHKVILILKKLYHFSTCKLYIYSHNFYAWDKFREDQYYIFLTHGQSLKDTSDNYPHMHKADYIITLSDFTRKLRSTSMKINEEKILKLGFPRNDILISVDKSIKDHFSSNLIVWLPTFRRHINKERNDSGTHSSSDIPFYDYLVEYLSINEILKENNFMLLLKPHPSQDLDYFKSINFSHIRIITDNDLVEMNINLYDLLAVSDALLTDYSSVYIDYLLTNKMIGFVLEDYNKFKNHKGFLVEDPLKYMPGHQIYDMNDLKSFIDDVIEGKDLYKSERMEIRQLMHENLDSNATKRHVDFIKQLMEGTNER